MTRTRTTISALALALSLAACGGGEEEATADEPAAEEPKTEKGASAESAGASAESAAEDEGAEGEAKAEPAAPKPVKRSREKLSASHILLMYEGAPKARETERTEEEAEKLATDLKAKLDGGADFAELAKKHSDCPSGERKGGDLGIFPANRMVAEFSEAVLGLEVGEISEPVETPFGFHIIKRQPVEEVHARHILVMHEESKRKPSSIKRSEKEARALIEQIAEKLEGGADFAELAKKHSDCPSGKRGGGDLGTFGRGRMAPAFEETAFALEENEVSDIVETEFGFHIIQRLP